tara:strand:+ start:1777 stop:2121 length:345 start_codon:yes stop_codon:yes gene_type:complete
LITEKLQNLLATHLAGLVNNGKVGLGGNSTFSSQTDLDVPLVAATSITAVQSDENVVQIKLTMSGSSASMTGQVIREIGVFDSSSNMLFRENFDGIGPFSSTDTLEFFIFLEVE